MLFMFQNGVRVSAVEPEAKVNATLKIDGKEASGSDIPEILAGDDFQLSMTASTTDGDNYIWGSLTLVYLITVKIPNESGVLTDLASNDDVLNYITVGVSLPIEGTCSAFHNTTTYELMEDEDKYYTIKFSVANEALEDVSMTNDFSVIVPITVKDTAPEGTQISFDIETNLGLSLITYYDSDLQEYSLSAQEPNFSTGTASLKVRRKSEDNTLSSVVVGTTSANAQTFAKTDTVALAESIDYNYNESTVISSVNITPTANDEYATIYMAAGSTAPNPDTDTPVTSGTKTSIALADGVRTVTILVKAETGTTKTYTITIVDQYAALSAFDIKVGTKSEGVTKIGLESGVTFAPDTLAYTVNVPSDYASSDEKVTITPTVADGHGIQTSIALEGTNSTPAASTVTSGSAVEVTAISDNGTLKFTVTASDNTTKREYLVTFRVWSVETGNIDVKVQGASKTYENDSVKAAEKKIDYYFLLSDEAECKGKFLITAQDGIPVKIGTTASATPEEYDANKEYGAGTYQIILTAPAGNTKTYIASLSKMEFLELAADSTYQFIFEETEGTGARAKTYLRTYHEKNMTHGVDDKDFEKIVLGNIAPKTTVNGFLSNINPSQLSMIRIYNNKNQLIYNCGQAIEGIDQTGYNKWSKYRISTSWYVQYGGTEENPLETIYISVLGDTSGNGVIDAADVVKMNMHITKRKLLEDLEVRLAAYVTNGGKVAASDISTLNQVIMLKKTIESYLYTSQPAVTASI